MGFLIYRVVARSRSAVSSQPYDFRTGYGPGSYTLDSQAAAELVERLNRPGPSHAGPSYEVRVEAPPPSRPPAAPSTAELVEQLRAIDWFQFEKLVASMYRKLGYAVTRRGGANPDGGIDLVIERGGRLTAIQCKQWKAWNVGVKAMREFLGALTDAGIPNGIFVTLRGYTGDAKQLADKHGIEIVNETGLVRLLEMTDARFDPEILEIFRDKRKVCPKCESEMVLRTAAKGADPGRQFWGCSTYPRCRFIMPYP